MRQNKKNQEMQNPEGDMGGEESQNGKGSWPWKESGGLLFDIEMSKEILSDPEILSSYTKNIGWVSDILHSHIVLPFHFINYTHFSLLQRIHSVI